mmetsp:Transcript_21240/g.32424  ORF Transcript_21240/g.32424 Transcript_21240/m.32424 type:complete len:521 (+) Transcript_21240:62-1624(+)
MRSRSLLNELFSYCRSESLSEDGLGEIIERHRLTTQNLSSFRLGRYKFFHAACNNDRVNEEIIRYLLEYFPTAASATNDDNGCLPLHYACQNPNMTLNIIQLLIDAAPASVRCQDNQGRMPLHCLCGSKAIKANEADELEVLKLLIGKHPEAVRRATNNNNGCLPIHIAGKWRSLEFCRVLIEAYPGSERITDPAGKLPLYYACICNTFATVEYLYKLHPDAINHAATNGAYPIHYAVFGVTQRLNPIVALGVVKSLLDCDLGVKLQKVRGMNSLLHGACRLRYNDSNIDVALEIIEAIFDAHPESIEENRIASDIQRYHQRVQTFINSQLVYARKAKNRRVMTTPDDNGQLPLHKALQSNVRLGSIKLLVRGNPHALQAPDNSGTLPLHVACQHHNSSNVVQYLVGLDTSTLDAVDKEGDTALHYACRGAKYDNIALLLETYDAVSVSKRNAHGKLPIDVLWESSAVEDRESIEYTESVFRLLRAYPETVMNYNLDLKQQGTSVRCSTQNGKKRKLDAV